MTSYVAILNEHAGGGRAKERARGVIERCAAQGITLDVRTTRHAGHATDLARDAFAQGARKFVAIGGDGTSYEVINGLFPAAQNDKVTFASLPLGTGNSFLRDFQITTEEQAVERFFKGKTTPVDVVRANHADGAIYYINLLSIGFSATVGALTNRRFKPFGAAGYPLAVVSSLVSLQAPRFAFRVDEGVLEHDPVTLLSFSNSKFTGGTMQMAPRASVSDGMLDIVSVAPMGRRELLATFPKIYEGKHLSHPKVSYRTAKKIEFAHDKSTPVMVDGEVIDLRLRALEVLPGVIEVVS